MFTLTGKAKFILFVIAVSLVVFGLAKFGLLQKGVDKLAPIASKSEVAVPNRANLPDFNTAAANYQPTKLPLPSDTPAHSGEPQLIIYEYPWNGHSALNLANGGPRTTRGSLFDQAGLDIEIRPLTMASDMLDRCMTFNEAYADNKPSTPVMYTQMGDGVPINLANALKRTKKLGAEYMLKVAGGIGRSFGEDAFWGPKAWVTNPNLARGSVICSVPLDGDWDILMIWAALNNIPVNSNPGTYDPNAINTLAASDDDYMKADDPFLLGTEYNLKNTKTGKMEKHRVDGFCTWSPVEEDAITRIGGLARIMSTRDNPAQMITTIIGVDKWMKSNRNLVVALLVNSYRAAEQMNHYDDAFDRAMEANAAIYGEKSAAEWGKYYRGFTLRDKLGDEVEVGGSGVFNLNDAMSYYGLDGTGDKYAAVYTQFGDIGKRAYPSVMPTYPKYESIIDLSYLQEAARQLPKSEPATTVVSFEGKQRGTPMGERSWHITFATGSATIDPSSYDEIDELVGQLTASNQTFVDLVGHTDNTGGFQMNENLSQARAQAVADMFRQRLPGAFPQGRLRVDFKGQRDPVADNNTPEGRAANRRVDVRVSRVR